MFTLECYVHFAFSSRIEYLGIKKLKKKTYDIEEHVFYGLALCDKW